MFVSNFNGFPKVNYSHIFSTTKVLLLANFKMSSCIFCNIVSGAQPTEFLYEDENLLVFNDIKPASKFHYLVITKQHIKNVKSLTEEHKQLIETLVNVGKTVLQNNGGNLNDVRFGFHVPPFNSIDHLHLHVISPVSEMSWLGSMVFKPNTWWFATPEHILKNLCQNKL